MLLLATIKGFFIGRVLKSEMPRVLRAGLNWVAAWLVASSVFEPFGTFISANADGIIQATTGVVLAAFAYYASKKSDKNIIADTKAKISIEGAN